MIGYTELRCEYYEVPKEGNYHVINSDGDQYWVVDGFKHRDNDLPACIYANGTQAWYQNGEKHRDTDNPALITADGTQYWYQNDKRHRVNNPAVIYVDGYVEYWYDNSYYKKQEYFDLMLSKGLITEKEYFAKLL